MVDAVRQAPLANASRLGKAGNLGLIAAISGLAILLVAAYGGPGGLSFALGSYLLALLFFTTLTLAFFGLTLLHHTLRATWSTSIFRLFEAGGGGPSLILMALLFAPILFNLGAGDYSIYEWVHPHVLEYDKIIQAKQFWLNPNGYLIRWGMFFLLWAALAWGLRASTLRQDAGGKDEFQVRTNFSAPGLVMFFLTVTFALTDWGMSLMPHWYSTIYGLWFIVGQSLGALALAVLILCLNADRLPYRDIVSPALTRDLGNMLFVLTMLWGYTSISQYLIIWNGNIPETTQFYVLRQQAWWGAVGMALIFGQFVIPFMMLVAPRVKATPQRLAKIAGWILFMRLLDIFYIIVPSFPKGFRPFEGPIPLLGDLGAFLLIGGLWFAVFGNQIKKATLLPKYDQRLQEAKHHAH
jgi:hypothetical protein